jgi:glycosyltransferase involved in cell wall biosynthesis
MKIVGITQGLNQPSTRFRWTQYIDDFTANGFEVSELESKFGAYAPFEKIKRPLWIAKSLAENILRTRESNKFDIRFLQRNLTATLCTFEPYLKRPLIFDVDDAIFLGPRGRSADVIAGYSSLVVCGNEFLANHFSKFAPVEVLPTAVDSIKFSPAENQANKSSVVIGWSGSSSGFKYLYSIEVAIKRILIANPDAVLKVVADKPPLFKTLPKDRVIFEKWTPQREVDVIREFTLGIMPLHDDLWARGKCSFKMLTYMAVGIPVVVSPVGMNLDILSRGNCGYAPESLDDWFDAITALLINESDRGEMGAVGRRLVESTYSRAVIAPKLVDVIKKFR